MPASPKRPRLAELELVEVADRAAWRSWLEANHATSPGIWLVVGKKGGSRTALRYEGAVEEALTFGWIDSTVRHLDADAFMQLFTPRKPGSTWSASNKARVERLIAEGRMTPAGLAPVERAKADGSWTLLDDVDALVLPPELADALADDAAAAEGFDEWAASLRKQAIYWLMTAKRPDTRAARVDAIVKAAAERRWPP